MSINISLRDLIDYIEDMIDQQEDPCNWENEQGMTQQANCIDISDWWNNIFRDQLMNHFSKRK